MLTKKEKFKVVFLFILNLPPEYTDMLKDKYVHLQIEYVMVDFFLTVYIFSLKN